MKSGNIVLTQIAAWSKFNFWCFHVSIYQLTKSKLQGFKEGFIGEFKGDFKGDFKGNFKVDFKGDSKRDFRVQEGSIGPGQRQK